MNYFSLKPFFYQCVYIILILQGVEFEIYFFHYVTTIHLSPMRKEILQ
jgi:hypothetical protein